MVAELAAAATMPAGKTAVSLDFLSRLVPSGLVTLAAIVPDSGPGNTYGRTFDLPRQLAEAGAWIDARQGVENLYFTLNAPKPAAEQQGRAGRLKEVDIAAIRGVAIDIDPRADVEAEAGGAERERTRLRGVAVELWSPVIGGPCAIIDSGGGIQAMWMFPESVPISPEAKREVQAQARGIARRFGSDAVHSLEHLFRLPGTVNVPDAKKRAKGRVPRVASILHFAAEERWPLESLTAVANPIEQDTEQAPTGAVDIGDAMAFLGSPDSLPEKLKRKIAAARNDPHSTLRVALTPGRERHDRSGPDWNIAKACFEEGFDGVEAASTLAAISPDKIMSDGEGYLERTIGNARKSAKVRVRPESHFEHLPEATSSYINWIDPTKWEGVQPDPLEWEVEGWIPRGEVTLLYGDGGIGKTLLIHQYATCAATGLAWLGQRTRPARVLCFFCEDSERELHRRQNAINRIVGVSHADLSNLRIASRKHEDNLFTLWDRNTGAMKRQAVWERLLADALAFQADVVIVDTIADTFSGSEIDRAQVSAFVKSCLGRLAFEIGGSVIALGHPSQAGSQSGSGTSGSTAWSNAARSRLFMKYPGKTDRGDFREVEGKKSNYGPKGNTLKIRWHAGAFEAISSSAQSVGPEQLPQTDNAAEKAVIGALISYGRNRLVMVKNSPYFAPKVLKAHETDGLAAFSAEEVESALNRLSARGAIKAETVGTDDHRRKVPGFVVIPDKLSALSANAAETPEAGV